MSGNAVVLVIIFLTRKLRSRMNIFMANLAIAGIKFMTSVNWLHILSPIKKYIVLYFNYFPWGLQISIYRLSLYLRIRKKFEIIFEVPPCIYTNRRQITSILQFIGTCYVLIYDHFMIWHSFGLRAHFLSRFDGGGVRLCGFDGEVPSGVVRRGCLV